MPLVVYSAGMKIEPLVESINKLTYGEEVDSLVKDTLKESKQLLWFIRNPKKQGVVYNW